MMGYSEDHIPDTYRRYGPKTRAGNVQEMSDAMPGIELMQLPLFHCLENKSRRPGG
jgi:hypothetical protein